MSIAAVDPPSGQPTQGAVTLAADGLGAPLSAHLLRLIAPADGRDGDDRAVPGTPLARFCEFLNALGVALYTTDTAGRLTFYNEAAVALWGRRPELGEEWCGSWRLYWPDGRPMRHDECPMAVALRERRIVRGYEAVAERPDGVRVSFVPHPTPLFDERGTMVGAVNVMVDVTERRAAEDALRAAADALRATAGELEASNAVKDEFLGLVSHELRTPVTTILGNAHLLRARGDQLDADQRDSMLADLVGDAERLRGIVENLLVLARLGTGHQAELEPQVLAQVTHKAVDDYRARHPAREIRLAGDARRAIVESDRAYLEMVLDNLLSNADKYSPPGTPVDVVLEADGTEARLKVLDRGIGIGAAELEAIFTPFYRSDSARSQANGVGIGLAVCKRVVESLGGRIWAGARPGGGSELGFSLPLALDVAS